MLSGPRRAGGSGAALGAEGRALERIQAGPGRAVMAARAGRGTGRGPGPGIAERSAACLWVVSSPALHSPGRGCPASRPGDEDLSASPARQAAAAAAGRLHCLTTARPRLSPGKPASCWAQLPCRRRAPGLPLRCAGRDSGQVGGSLRTRLLCDTFLAKLQASRSRGCFCRIGSLECAHYNKGAPGSEVIVPSQCLLPEAMCVL